MILGDIIDHMSSQDSKGLINICILCIFYKPSDLEGRRVSVLLKTLP